jgi:beta-1,3-galactosyltransferase 5
LAQYSNNVRRKYAYSSLWVKLVTYPSRQDLWEKLVWHMTLHCTPKNILFLLSVYHILEIFRDLIQSSSFTDGYGEASRKGISLIHWSLLNCPQATFTAKADDDCWINIPHYLNILQRKQNDKKILGLFWPTGASVIRDRKNKWSVDIDEGIIMSLLDKVFFGLFRAVHLADYPLAKFPPYVSGILYAFHKDILLSIAQAVTKLHYLWHDDVFLTGIAAQEAKVGHITLQGYDLRGDVWTKACSKKTFLAIHYVNDEKMRILWNDQCASYNISC